MFLNQVASDDCQGENVVYFAYEAVEIENNQDFSL